MAGAWRRPGSTLVVLCILLAGLCFVCSQRTMLQSGSLLELQSAIVATRASERMTLEQLAACLDDPFCAGKMKLKDEVTINSGDNSTIGFNLTVNAGGSGFPRYRDGDLDSCSEYSRVSVGDPPSDSRYRREEWEGWHNMYLEIGRSYGDDIDLVFFGDSITIKWNEYPNAFWCDQFTSGDTCSATVRPIFEKYFGYPYNGVALGIAGDSSLHLLKRLQNGEMDRMKPKAAVVLIGTNDLSWYWDRDVVWGSRDDVEAVADAIARGVTNVVVQIKKKHCDTRVLLQGILPRGDGRKPCEECYDRYKPVITRINELLEEFASFADGVEYIYCGDLFLTDGGRKMNTDLAPDLLHPETEGYDVLAQCLADRLRGWSELADIPRSDLEARNFFFDDPIEAPVVKVEDVRMSDLFTSRELSSGCDASGTGVCYTTQELPTYRNTRRDCDDWEEVEIPDGQLEGRDDIPEWDAKHEEYNDMLKAAADNAHLVLFGDTVVEQLASEYRNVMDKELMTRYNTLALGIEGDTSLNLLQRLRLGEVDGIRARAAVVHTGAYDLTKYYPADVVMGNWDEDAYLEYAALRLASGIIASAARIKLENCDTHVVVMGMLPRGNTRGSCELCIDNYEEVIGRVNSVLKSFAEEGRGTSFVDCGDDLTSSGRLNGKYVRDDGISLTEEGMERVVSCLGDALEDVDELDDIDEDSLWANRVYFKDLFTSNQLDSSCSSSEGGACFTDQEVEGYAGQNIIECSEKRDLQLPVGTADGRDEEDEWKAIFEAHKAIGEEYGSEVDLLLFGDDTIAAWGGAHEDNFESALGARYNAVPFGIAGDTALNALWRLQNGEASRINAKSVVLHVGANDIDRYIPSEVRTSDDFGEKEMQRRIDVAADRVANATQAAALQILKSNCDVTVLVLGLIPREDESYESINAAVNARLRAFGESDYIKGIDFLDCRDALSDRRGRFDSDLYERDGVRLNDRGMEALAVCIQENLLEVDDLTRVESLGRSFYKEARAGTIFNSVDHRISVLPELPRDVDDCDEWKELNLSDGSADMRLSDPQWVSDHEQYSRVIDAFGKHVHLAFFGDDNTLRWNGEGRRVFEERYAFKYNALALGKGGDTSQNLIWRLRNGELGGPESSFAPDAVVLNVGSNDLLAYVRQSALLGDEGDDVLEDAAEAVGRSIQHAVGAIKQTSCQTQVVVLGLLPRGDLDGGRDFRNFKDMHEHVNKFLERWADDLEGVTFVDCSRALLDGSRVERDFYERNYVELNRDGFEDLADCLDDTLKDLLPREDDALSLRTNLILSDPDGADLLSSDLASLFSAEDLDTDCRAESDRTCYRATRVPLDERTTSAYECEDWLELDLPDGSLDGRDDERDWERAHDKIVDVLDDIDSAAEGPKLLFVGDDNVAAWNSEELRPMFENFFAEPFGALALGIAGDTSLNLLSRLHEDDMGGMVPEVAVLSAGVNDLVRYFPGSVLEDGDDDALRLVADRIINGTAAGVVELKKRYCGAHVVLLALLPRNKGDQCGRCDWDSHFGKVTETVNARMASFWEDGDGVTVLNCNAGLLDDDGELLNDMLSSDGVALSADGMRHLAECLYTHLRMETPFRDVDKLHRSPANVFFGGELLDADKRKRSPSPDEGKLLPLFLPSEEAADCDPPPSGKCFKTTPIDAIPSGIKTCAEWAEVSIPIGSSEGREKDEDWNIVRGLFVGKLAQVAQVTDLVFYGDQMVQAWNSRDGRDVFEEQFAFTYNAVAFGIPGDTSHNLLWRLQNGELPAFGSNLSAVVIHVGINDLLRYYPDDVITGQRGAGNMELAAQRVANSIRAAAAQVRQSRCAGTTVFVMGILPRRSPNDCDERGLCADVLQPAISAVNAEIAAWAEDSQEVEFVDCGEDFLLNGGRDINTRLMPDGRNPNEDGMRALASCLAVPFYTRSGLGESSPNALGLNLFFTSSLPDKIPSPVVAAPTAAPAPAPVVVAPREASSGSSLGLLTADERKVDCTAARCYKDDSLPTVDPSDVQSCSSTTASSTTATKKWVIYGDDAVAGLAASDYVTNFRGVQPVLHGSPRTTTEALQAALLPRGRPLSPDAQDAAGAHVYLLVGANDVLVNFPPRVALLPSGDPVMQAAAQRVANATTLLAATMLSEACAARVTVVALPPQPYSVGQEQALPIADEINSLEAAWAASAPGIDSLDCSLPFVDDSGRMRPELYLSGGAFGLSIEGEDVLMACLVAHFSPSSSPSRAPTDDSAKSPHFIGNFGPPSALENIFTVSELASDCRPDAEATCFSAGAREVPLPALPTSRDTCAAWQGVASSLPLGDDEGRHNLPLWKSLHSKHEERVQAYAVQGNLAVVGGSEVELLYLMGYNSESTSLRTDFAALELGIPGDTSTNLLWRLQNGEANGLRAKVVVLWVGSSDISRYIPNRVLRHASPEAVNLAAERVANGTLAALAQLKAEGCSLSSPGDHAPPYVVIMGVLPRGDSTGGNKYLYDEYRGITTAVNGILQSAARRQKGAAFLNCGSRLMFNTRYLDDQLLPDGYLNDHESPGMSAVADCLHEFLIGLADEGRLSLTPHSAADPNVEWDMGAWGECSAACGGWRTRTAMCRDLDGDIVDESRCLLVARPEVEREACNSDVPCLPVSWVAAPWGACSASCDIGTAHRDVWCMDATGRVPSDACADLERPPTTKPCQVAACDYCATHSCFHGGTCSNGACVCPAYFDGALCEVHEGCASGVTDAEGYCCEGTAIDAATGECCPAGATTDSLGVCCSPDDIDACGHCGGTSTAVDIFGVCCAGTLDAAGVCCPNGAVDDCGVCGGQGLTCRVKATVRLELTPTGDREVERVECAAVHRRLSETMSALLYDWRVVESDVSVAVLSASGFLGEDCTVESAAGKPSRSEIAELGIRSRRLLQPRSDDNDGTMVVELTVAPRPDLVSDGDEPLPTLSAMAVRVLLNANGVEAPVRGYETTAASVRDVTRDGECGNGWCEVGEASAAPGLGASWTSSLSTSLCRDDCPTVPLPCPPLFGNGAGGPCTSHGICVAALGVCRCDLGYNGEDCSECDVGFIRQASSCVRPPTGEAPVVISLADDGSRATPGSSIPGWAIALAIVGSLAILAFAAFLFARIRKRSGEGGGKEPSPAEAPAKVSWSAAFRESIRRPTSSVSGAEGGASPGSYPLDYGSAKQYGDSGGGKDAFGTVVMGTPADDVPMKHVTKETDAEKAGSSATTPRVYHHHHYHHHDMLPTTSTSEAPPAGGMLTTPRNARLPSLGAESAADSDEGSGGSGQGHNTIPASFAGMSVRMEEEMAEMAAADVDIAPANNDGDIPTAGATVATHRPTESDADVYLTQPPMDILDEVDASRISPVIRAVSHDGSGRAAEVAASLRALSQQGPHHGHGGSSHHPPLVRAGHHSRRHSRQDSMASDDAGEHAPQTPVSWALSDPYTPPIAERTEGEEGALCPVPIMPPPYPKHHEQDK